MAASTHGGTCVSYTDGAAAAVWVDYPTFTAGVTAPLYQRREAPSVFATRPLFLPYRCTCGAMMRARDVTRKGAVVYRCDRCRKSERKGKAMAPRRGRR